MAERIPLKVNPPTGAPVEFAQFEATDTLPLANHAASVTGHISDATLHRIINDAGTTVTELFSASEIIARLATKEPANANIQSHISDATLHRIINDAGTTVTELFSASEIIARLATKEPANANIQTHIADDTLHRVINDLGTTVTELFSADRILTSEAAVQEELCVLHMNGALGI